MFPALAPSSLQDIASRDALLHSPEPESQESVLQSYVMHV